VQKNKGRRIRLKKIKSQYLSMKKKIVDNYQQIIIDNFLTVYNYQKKFLSINKIYQRILMNFLSSINCQ